jgi:hypothetical protein
MRVVILAAGAAAPVRRVAAGCRTAIPRPVQGPESMPVQNPCRHDR